VTEALSALGPGPSNNRVVPQKLQSGDGETIDAEAEPLVEESAGGEETPGPISTKVKKSKGYTVMDDFDLSPEGAPSLKEYCAAKDPQTEQDKFLVASAWLQTHGGADPFTPRHLFTCFRTLGWKTQVDMTQPLRNLKLKKSYYENIAHGEWRLTKIGLDAVEDIHKE
jgi:hypothetical protein